MKNRAAFPVPAPAVFAAVLAAVLSCVGAPARAQQVSREAVEAGLYQEAMEALAEGRRTDASALLRRLVANPQQAGALLDLALTQCGLGNADEAERLFAMLETRVQLKPEMMILIAETREAGCKPWKPARTTSVSFGRGIDQNVNQGASVSSLVVDTGVPVELPLLPDFLPRHDQYSVIGLDHMRELTPNGSIGYLQTQWRRNDSLRQYDTAAIFGGVELPWRVLRTTVRTSLNLGAITLGRRLYQRQGQLQARVAPPIPLPANTQLNLVAGASWYDYPTLTNFNSVTLEGRAVLSYRDGPLFASASAALLDDHARTGRPGGNRHGNYASMLVRRTLPAGFTGEFAYTRQSWNSAQPYAPGLLIDAVRAQRTGVARAALSYQLAKGQTLQLEARAVQNKENIPIFQYNDRVLQLSWQWQLP
jgi:hypothetical protein